MFFFSMSWQDIVAIFSDPGFILFSLSFHAFELLFVLYIFIRIFQLRLADLLTISSIAA